MRWHYIEEDEWPVSFSTVMVRTLKEFDGMIPAFFVQKQTSPMTNKFFRYDLPKKEIEGVETWCSFTEIQNALDESLNRQIKDGDLSGIKK